MAKLLNNIVSRLFALCCLLILLYFLPDMLQWKVQPTIGANNENNYIARDKDKEEHGLRADSHKLGVSKRVLFFNRVPKTGSEMLVLLLSWLQRRNGFTHIRLKSSVIRHMDAEQQVSLAAEVANRIAASSTAHISFDQHVHFTNFSQLGLEMPVFINILRHPIEKLASRFYYARATPRPDGYTPPWSAPSKDIPPYSSLEDCMADGHPQCSYILGGHYDLTIPYFCGHEPHCRELGNREALATAKRNMERYYPVVGVLENLNATLSVLEARLPKYFAGVTQLYYGELGAPHLNKNYHRPPTIQPAAEKILRRNLSLEINFYNYAKNKLVEQSAVINR